VSGTLIVVLRLIHVGLGVFWGGSVLFAALFLDPAARASGPAGGQVMGAIAKRGFTQTMLTVGTLTVASGWYLFWLASGGLSPTYVGAPQGIAFLIGGLAATIALGVGFFVSRPTFARIGVLMAAAATAQEADRPGIMARVAELRVRMTMALRGVASLLAIAVVAMAVGRYV
jgi:hypothetical protein